MFIEGKVVYTEQSHLCPPPTTTAAPDCFSPTPKPMEGQAAAVSSADFSTLVIASLTGKKDIFSS